MDQQINVTYEFKTNWFKTLIDFHNKIRCTSLNCVWIKKQPPIWIQSNPIELSIENFEILAVECQNQPCRNKHQQTSQQKFAPEKKQILFSTLTIQCALRSNSNAKHCQKRNSKHTARNWNPKHTAGSRNQNDCLSWFVDASQNVLCAMFLYSTQNGKVSIKQIELYWISLNCTHFFYWKKTLLCQTTMSYRKKIVFVPKKLSGVNFEFYTNVYVYVLASKYVCWMRLWSIVIELTWRALSRHLTVNGYPMPKKFKNGFQMVSNNFAHQASSPNLI